MPVLPKKKTKKTKATKYAAECDALFSRLVRTAGRCESGRSARHGGVLQCAHGFSRRYRAIRWDRRNAWCFCQACHLYFTHRPLEWDLWLQATWGSELYDEMRETALAGEKQDLKELHANLKAQAKEFA